MEKAQIFPLPSLLKLEIRKNYISGLLCITPLMRVHNEPFCIFCPGYEESTPPAELVLQHREFGLVKTADSPDYRETDWSVRVVRYADPVLTLDSPSNYSPEPFVAEPAKGVHYAIIAGREHDKVFHELSLEQISETFLATQETLKKALNTKGVRYASAFVDDFKGKKGYVGHPHLQVVGLPTIPPVIEKEASLIKRQYEETGTCPYCSIIAAERNGPRQVLSGKYYISIVPWSPKHEYEVWILPIRHQRSFLRITQREMSDLSLILKATLKAFHETAKMPYSFVFHLGSERRSNYQFHWHIEAFSPTGLYGGLQGGLGVKVLETIPEKMAERISKRARKEVASLVGVI